MTHQSDDLTSRIEQFDRGHGPVLRRIWLLGDVHGHFKPLERSLEQASLAPHWLVFLGDLDLEHKPFREHLAALQRQHPQLRVAFIHGNHDADSYQHWELLHDCGDAVALHGKVLDLDGVKVAGLGGNFQGRVWMPPGEAVFANRTALMERFAFPGRGQRPAPKYLAAIYKDEFEALAALQADILVTHEAPSCHHHGHASIDELARCLGVKRAFHGHHHDDLSDEYAKVRVSLGFDARGVDFCGIKNGLGEMIWEMDVERGHA